MAQKTLSVNNYPATIYQEGEIQITIPRKAINRHLEEGDKVDFPVYLRECDLREMLALIESDRAELNND